MPDRMLIKGKLVEPETGKETRKSGIATKKQRLAPRNPAILYLQYNDTANNSCYSIER
jgi:hypothetical protein